MAARRTVKEKTPKLADLVGKRVRMWSMHDDSTLEVELLSLDEGFLAFRKDEDPQTFWINLSNITGISEVISE